jgi:hypothetical protein
VKLLTINQSDPQLFFLSCIDEHSFHVPLLLLSERPTGRWETGAAAWRSPRGGEGFDQEPVTLASLLCSRPPLGA